METTRKNFFDLLKRAGYPFTSPNVDEVKKYIEKNNITKEQFINLYLEVVTAPFNLEGIELVGTDLRDSKILSGEIKTREQLAYFSANQY